MEEYNHIQLTDNEIDECILEGKRRKESLMKLQEIKDREEQNRRLFTSGRWSYEQIESFMVWRSGVVFEGRFRLDTQSEPIFRLLCAYFSEDVSRFEELAKQIGIQNGSLKKGICLAGMPGLGKTWMMKLFQKNQRQVFAVQNAKNIADIFEQSGEESLSQFVELPKLPVNDSQSFFHPVMALCIDDLGTEDTKNHYGNKKNVLGDIIEKRYACNNVGILFHCTTNLTGPQLTEKYGPRVASRLREIMNIVELKGEDRRK